MEPTGSSRTSQTWRGYSVGRHPFPGERAQFRRGSGRSRLQLHGGADFLAKLGMRNADHSHLGDGLMLVQDNHPPDRQEMDPANVLSGKDVRP